MSEKPVLNSNPTVTSHSYAEWAKGLRFGLYYEQEIIAQVRRIAEQAYEAGRQVGRLEALTRPDDAQ